MDVSAASEIVPGDESELAAFVADSAAVVAGSFLASQLRPASRPAAPRTTPPSGRMPLSRAVR